MRLWRKEKKMDTQAQEIIIHHAIKWYAARYAINAQISIEIFPALVDSANVEDGKSYPACVLISTYGHHEYVNIVDLFD